MRTYRYTAIDSAGAVVRGSQSADNLRDLEDRLARQRLELLDGREQRSWLALAPRHLPGRELINILIHLQTLSAAGVPLIESLVDLRDSSDTPTVRAFAGDLVDRIEGGATLSQALAQSPWGIEPVIVNLVQTGEATGKLPEVLLQVIENLKWNDEIATQTRKLLRTPALTAAVVLGAIGFLMVYLVPQLLAFIRTIGGDIPPQTRALMWTSRNLTEHGWVLVVLPVALWALMKLLVRASDRWHERIDAWILALPPIGPILKKIVMARFANSFALMYRSGVSVLDAIGYCKGLSDNRAYQRALEQALAGISEGQKISEAFGRLALFPPLVIRMLRVGENTGALDSALDNVSYFYRREVNDSVDRLQAAIQPTLTVFLGAMVAWILSAVLLPIYDLIATIRF